MNRKLVIVFRIKWWEMDFGLVWRLDLVIAWSELVISCLDMSVSGFEIKMGVVAGKMDEVWGKGMCDAVLRNLSDILSDCQKCLCHYCRCLFGNNCYCCEEYDTGNV